MNFVRLRPVCSSFECVQIVQISRIQSKRLKALGASELCLRAFCSRRLVEGGELEFGRQNIT